MNEDPETTVSVLLDAAGLHAVPDAERQRLAELYPALRRTVDRFYDIDVADGVTAAVLRAGER